MDKKTIIIIAITVVVLGGAYYGYNRWRQQQLANQILKQMYGINTGGGILDKMTGAGGNISGQMAQEIAKIAAKEEAKQKEDEKKEAAKTPQDRYNETEEVAAYDAASKAAAGEAKEIIEKVFGSAKLTGANTNNYTDQSTSYSIMEFKISRLATGADLGALSKALADKGLPVIQSGISDKSATVSAGSNETAVYTFAFEIGSQDVSANIIKVSQ
ncbi:MAG: hypothetical protein WCW77_02760 [Patescibacteria group bacterium]|jgi:hypothetical protein